MLADIEAGKVGTVIVKDMSRLGRNYLQVGFYGDQLITLSTCTNRSQDERFVLVGRQIQHQDS